MNIAVITADDLSYFSLTCAYPKVTPTLDSLASQGVSFAHAHTNIGLCEPARCVLMTGLYPHNNGATGFCPIKHGTTTLSSLLKKHGYFTGIMGKIAHHRPPESFSWDVSIPAVGHQGAKQLGNGQNPGLYAQHAKSFVAEAKAQGKPYFLLANSHDPHRPFMHPSHDLNEIEVPCFLEDTTEVRSDLSAYFTSVGRLDRTVSAILSAIDLNDTIVVFTSDHGMSFPFVKANCYSYSSNIPLIIVWKDHIKPHLDDEHMISSVDLMSTLLELLKIPAPFQDGSSYAPLLFGMKQDRKMIYSMLNSTAISEYQMRAILTKGHCYIRNYSKEYPIYDVDAWGFREAVDMLSARHDAFINRPSEELYDIVADPCCLHNLNNTKLLFDMRHELSKIMSKHKDPLARPVIPL